MNWYKKSQLEVIDNTDNLNSREEYRNIAHDLYYRTEKARIDTPNYILVYTDGVIEAEPETMDKPSHAYYSQWDDIDYSNTFAGRYSPSTKTITIVRPMGIFQFKNIPTSLKGLLRQKFPEAQKLSIHASTQSWYKKSQQELPSNFDTSELGKCMIAAELITKNLLSKGITNFNVVEGWINFPGYDEESNTTHTWIELNGEIIDPTKEQFQNWGFNPDEISYEKIKKKYSPQEYLKLCERYPT